MSKRLKIGLDVDGISAAFSPSFKNLLIRVSGRDLFLPGDDTNSPVWDFDKLRGYTSKERQAAWRHITAESETFWADLPKLPGAYALADVINDLEHDHEVYFVTSRAGRYAKRQTEEWVKHSLNYHWPTHPTTILVGTGQKGAVAAAIGLDLYLDDHWDNAIDVALQSPRTKNYLLNYRHNFDGEQRFWDDPSMTNMSDIMLIRAKAAKSIIRVDSVHEMLKYEFPAYFQQPA